MKRRAAAILGILLVLAAAAWTLYSTGRWKKLWPWEKAKAAEVRTAKVSKGDVEVRFKEMGRLAAKVDDQVRPPVDGQVKRLEVQEGDPVKRGQALAVIQPGRTEAEQRLYVPTTVRSPIDGEVVYLNANEGDIVTAGKDDFMRVADLRRMIVRLDINEMDVNKLKPGQEASISVDVITGSTFTARVFFISPAAIDSEKQSNGRMDSNPRKFLVKVELGATDPRMRPGMTARIDLLLDKRAGVLKAPLAAVFEEMGKASVYVKGPASVEEREVRLGLRSDDEAEVLAGLKEGETLLLEKPAEPPLKVPLPAEKK